MDKKENREKMITGGLGYLGLLFFTAGLLKLIEDKSGKGLLGKFFEYVPAVVCLYLVTMVLGSSGLWENTPEIVAVSSSTSSVLLPALIFLLLLRSDLRKVIKLGPRMIAVFVICSLSIMVSFVLGYLLFRGVLGAADSWKPLSALCGSWIGGTVNMVSIQGALGVSQGDMGYVLMTDTVSYAVWLILMLLVVPWSRRFDRWSGADGSGMEKEHYISSWFIGGGISGIDNSWRYNVGGAGGFLCCQSGIIVIKFGVDVACGIRVAFRSGGGDDAIGTAGWLA